MESKITLKNQEKQFWKIERFVEEIADEYNIFNSYYSNILISLVEIADRQEEITIHFGSGKKGLIFTVIVENKDNINDQDLEFLLSKITDEFHVTANQIEIVFSINSINKELSSNRQKKFREYVRGVGVKKNEEQ